MAKRRRSPTTPGSSRSRATGNERKKNVAWDPYEAGRRAVESLKRVGGVALSREAAADRLNVTLATIYNRISKNEIVVWTDADGLFRFPKWQFAVRGMLPGVSECLQILDSRDHWAVMRFFLSPSAMTGDATPLQLLQQGRIAEARAVALAAGVHS